MKRGAAWVLLLTTGLPTPALWRKPKSHATGSSSRTTVRVVVRPAAPQRAARQPVGWLSDDPELADYVAEVTTPAPRPAPATPPTPRVRRQPATRQPAKTPPVPAPAPQKPAPAVPARAPRTKAEKAAAERASWPSSWGALAAGWDDHR